MKNFTLLIALSASLSTFAGDRAYNRLLRLFGEDQWKCLRLSKKYINRLPEKSAPYYFASAVYMEKSQTHGQIKTRYMMMSKSLRYATKFEELGNLDMMSRVNWGAYVLELQKETNDLIRDLDSHDLSNLGNRLDNKCDHLVYLRNSVTIDKGAVLSLDTISAHNEQASSIPESTDVGYFGLASGNEVAPSANKIQEQKLMELINQERKEQVMSPVKWDESLARAARYHANDMAKQDYLSNDSYDRIDDQLVFVIEASTRIDQFHSKNRVYDQSITAGALSAESALLEWIGDEDAYDNIFNEENKSVGIGIAHDPNSTYGYYWVIVVSRKH